MMNKAVMRLEGVRKVLGLLAGMDFLQAIFIIGQSYFLSLVITRLWEGGRLSAQWRAIIIFLVCFILRAAINYIKDEVLDKFAVNHAQQLRQQLLQKLFELGPLVVQDKGAGNVITMALEGVTLTENYVHLILNKMMNLSIIPWVIVAFIFYLDWKSGTILLVMYPLIMVFMVILGYAAKARADRQYASYQRLSNHFLDSLRGIDTLKYFGLSKRYARSIYNTSDVFRKATMSSLKIGILSSFALDFFTTLSIAIVAVLLGLRLLNAQIHLLPALTILVLAPEYFLPVRDFSSDYHATLDGKNAMEAIQQVLHTPTRSQQHLNLPQWSDTSSLTLQHLTVSYADSRTILDEIQFNATGFSKIGIVGLSGSGKSTMIKILSGFMTPQSGTIQVENQTVTHLNEDAWRKQLTYIPQSPYVFNMSLKDNVAFYTPQASDADIMEAIRIVGLTDLVDSLDNGMDTIIGNGARPLSGGQAQRIALARAFLDKDRRILLFDEPTAHLDIETELELKTRILPLMENRLVIFATHRLHWLKHFDTIVVLEDGKIVETGDYATLLAKKGELYRLKNVMGGNRHA